VGAVTVTGNVLRNAPAGLLWMIGTPQQRITDVAVRDNELRVTDGVYAGTPIAALFFTRCDGVTVSGNTGRFRTAAPVGVVEVRDCTGVTVDGNAIEGAGGALVDTTGTPVPR
jgi:hypothetical protein